MGNVGAAAVSTLSTPHWPSFALAHSPPCVNVDRSAVFFDPHRWSPSSSSTGMTVLVPSSVDIEAAAESAPPALVLASGDLDPALAEHAWNATIPLHTRLVRPGG